MLQRSRLNFHLRCAHPRIARGLRLSLRKNKAEAKDRASNQEQGQSSNQGARTRVRPWLKSSVRPRPKPSPKPRLRPRPHMQPPFSLRLLPKVPSALHRLPSNSLCLPMRGQNDWCDPWAVVCMGLVFSCVVYTKKPETGKKMLGKLARIT